MSDPAGPPEAARPPSSPSPPRPGRPPLRSKLAGRAAVLAVVICAIALSLAYPVREYIGQRQQISQLVAQRAATLAQVKSLQAEQARLSDRAYIEQLARQELDMCFPGTQCYIVEGSQPVIGSTRPSRPGPAPWYDKLWR